MDKKLEARITRLEKALESRRVKNEGNHKESGLEAINYVLTGLENFMDNWYYSDDSVADNEAFERQYDMVHAAIMKLYRMYNAM